MNKTQMSDSLSLGLVLALAGGFMDAYSYLFRGHVFANGQTGNMVLLGINLFEGNYLKALSYILPIVSFVIGVVIVELIKLYHKGNLYLHWRQSVLFAEIIVLSLVSLFTQELNFLANSLISLACGMQVEAFRKVQGHGSATTMCVGNLRSGTELLCKYFSLKNAKFLKSALIYYFIIIFFIMGAIIGNYAIKLLKQYSILLCSFILLLALLMMFVNKEQNKKAI